MHKVITATREISRSLFYSLRPLESALLPARQARPDPRSSRSDLGCAPPLPVRPRRPGQDSSRGCRKALLERLDTLQSTGNPATVRRSPLQRPEARIR